MSYSAEFLPRIVSVNSGCGCSLTKASVQGLTPTKFEALAGTETNLAQVIASSAEAKALGVPESSLSTLLKSSIRNIKGELNKQKIAEQSIILPYIQRRQRQVQNANYFVVEAGAAAASAGANGIPANAVDLTVNLGPTSRLTFSSFTDIERYFLPGMTIHVLTWDDSTARNALTLQYKIHLSVNANAGGVEKATITVSPLGKSDATPAQLKTGSAYGIVMLGANNVSDYEAWCENQPTDNNLGLVTNWFQTSRESRCISQVYKDTLARVLAGETNAWDQHFNYLPLAEQNKIAAMHSEKAWLNSVWFNDYLDTNQTIEGYANLPKVTDPEDDSCTLEYKANALGLYTIMAENNRVIDLNGAALDMDTIFGWLYELKRQREAGGDKISVIDCMTDRKTANLIFETMAKYYKARYGWETTRFANLGQKVEFNGQVMFDYDLYDIPDASVQLGVFRERFFDDHLDIYSATAAGGAAGAVDDFANRGRSLVFVDWSDISVGIGKTNSITRKSPDPNTSELYRCRMNANVKEYNLRSTQWSTFVDRPNRHLIVQNFASLCPTATAGAGCAVPNPA